VVEGQFIGAHIVECKTVWHNAAAKNRLPVVNDIAVTAIPRAEMVCEICGGRVGWPCRACPLLRGDELQELLEWLHFMQDK
jgi:hypothetical protein